MNATGDPSTLALLANRAPILTQLAATPSKKCDLADELGISRSTVDRAIAELEERDLVERTGHTYRTTLAGELALAEFDRFADRVDDIVAALPVLEALPADAPFDPVLLEGADVSAAVDGDDAADLERLIDDATGVRLFTCDSFPDLIETFRVALEDGLAGEFAVTSGILDELLTDHRETVAAALSTGDCSLRVAPDRLPYGLGLFRTGSGPVAVAAVYDDGEFVGCVRNDDPAAVEWARTTLEERWSATTPLTLEGER